MGNRHKDDLHPCALRQPAFRTSQSLAQAPNHSVRDTVQGKRQITVLKTLHDVRDTLRFFAQSAPASRPTSQRLDPKHRVQTTHNDVSDIPCQKTPNDVRDIEPHPDLAQWLSTRLWLARVSRSVGVFLCVAVVVARLVFPSPVSLLDASPRLFSSFWRFPVSRRSLSGSSFLCRK